MERIRMYWDGMEEEWGRREKSYYPYKAYQPSLRNLLIQKGISSSERKVVAPKQTLIYQIADK